MVSSGENIWTWRFQLLLGLVLIAQIVLVVIVYMSFGNSYTAAELALTAFVLLCGVGFLGWLREPAPRKNVLRAGLFVLIALLILLASLDLQGKLGGRSPVTLFRHLLSYGTLVVALLAFEGKVVTRKAAWTDSLSRPTSWFIRLSHLALAGVAGIELLLQIFLGNRLLLLHFASRLYDGVSLNSAAAVLLGLILVCSLIRFNSPSTQFDGWMVLILSMACFLLQYTFGPRELANIDPRMSPSLLVGTNLVLSIVPLALAVFALFSQWGRLFATLWLATQLLILQSSFLGGPPARPGTRGVFVSVLANRAVLYILAIALVMLALRLLIFWDRRQLNVIDGIAVAVITLVLGTTMWSLGQSYLQQASSLLTTPQGTNLLSLADGLIIIAYLMGIFVVLTLGLVCVNRILRHKYRWLGRIESVVEAIMVLAITIGALLLLNSIGNQSNYLAAATLNPQALSTSLPDLKISNQYVLDGLFALILLIYASALARQHWNRLFAHTERILVLLSGGVCLLILASSEKRPILPLVSSTMQQIMGRILPVFTVERLVTTSLLAAALVSLFWLTRSRNMVDRIVLIALFGSAAISALGHYFSTPPPQLLLALMLLMLGTLIAARMERVQQVNKAHVDADTLVDIDTIDAEA